MLLPMSVGGRPVDPGSFRDRKAHVFHRDDHVYRALDSDASQDWRALRATRFFARGQERGQIVGTVEVDPGELFDDEDHEPWVTVLRHDEIPFISYPYEWPMGMLRDAALLHLELLLVALDEELILKDSSAFNVQWRGSSPVFIDIPSFERMEPGTAWAGYRQFCEMFVYPLFLQAYEGVSHRPWLRGRLDGIDAEACLALMSLRDYLRPGVLKHVYLQARMKSRHAETDRDVREELKHAGFSPELIAANARQLKKIVRGLRPPTGDSEWSAYVDMDHYDADDRKRKDRFVRDAVGMRGRRLVWDLGCNIGHYSRIAAVAADGESLLDTDGPARRSKTIYYGAAHGHLSYSLEEVVERRQASLARKISLFGPEGDPLRRGGSVVDRRFVGRPVAQIDRADEGSIVASIHYPHLLAEVDLDSEFLPARVRGTVSGPETDRFVEDEGELAIALNGVVAATTRSVPDIDSDGASSWAAILPEEAFRQGCNRLGVYVVESTRDGPLLRPAYETEGATTDRDNLILPMPSAQWTSAVEVEGFRRLEWDPEGQPVRWTAPSGTIRVPVDPDEPPAGIDLHVRYVDPRGHRLRLMVNGCTFFSRRVRDAFEERILFADRPVEGSELRLELVSDRFDPEPRPVGVGVSSVVLVDGPDEGT